MHHYCMFMPLVSILMHALFVLRAQVQHTIAVGKLEKHAKILRATLSRSMVRAHAAACMLQRADALRSASDATGMDMYRTVERTARVRRRM